MNHYDGFEVYYQPIVDCQSEQIIGAEALMRFSMITEEGREFVSPMEFIPLLEAVSYTHLKFTNQKYKQTILLVTHDEKIALQANRIITIGDGKIIKDEVMK